MNAEPKQKVVPQNEKQQPTHIANSLGSEGSSSDCVIVETTVTTNGIDGHVKTFVSNPFSVLGKSSNGPSLTVPSDQDSGVDVTGGLTVAGVAESTTPVKRKRGRPRKEPGSTSPAK